MNIKKTLRISSLALVAALIGPWTGTTAATEAPSFNESFKGFDACFLLYDVNAKKLVAEYNPGGRCKQRIAPDSTFKVPLSLMAFNEKLIEPQTVFKWNGQKYERSELNRDQTPRSWLQDSVVWVSQDVAPSLGYARIGKYLDDFRYGNLDFTGDIGKNNGLTNAWLSSSLQISAYEQLEFLKAMEAHQLPVSREAIDQTRQNMALGKLENGADIYGKTGAGRHRMRATDRAPGKLRDGWFVGFVEGSGEHYIFVGNLTDRQAPAADDHAAGSQVLKPIVMRILNDRTAH
ncbi:beta-lactamase class D [Variovorax sp. HW608]|uniref:class D beta-lactamase n=1 Tax=Variovorax sp. HW608 TaxID=1034889 RepID=UPI00081FCEB3|nr:class D beta-lactamase [Variovorax sp. HW608]SCK34122.1 beta-lactamase class D [Variovorax sp. HW608]